MYCYISVSSKDSVFIYKKQYIMKRNLFRDILRDTNSRKYSMTKVAAFTSLLLLIAAVSSAIAIMIIEKEIDHICSPIDLTWI